MAAPKGNQFWKLRSKHGRDTLFASPELLREAAHEYFNWVDAHPWYKVEAVKSGDQAGKLLKIPIARPYTVTGFLLYVGANEAYWRQFKGVCSEDFSTVINEVEQTMFTQKFEGAAVGAFNGNIISRDLGLIDKKDVTSKGKIIGQPSPIIVQPLAPTDAPILEQEPDTDE